MRLGWYALTVLALALPGCDDDSVAPALGDIEVTVETTGDGTDADGFNLVLDPGTDPAAEEDIDVDGTVTFEDVAEGSHEVELTDLANNCSVDGDNPVTVSVTGGATENVTFDVTCAETTGG